MKWERLPEPELGDEKITKLRQTGFFVLFCFYFCWKIEGK